MAAVPNIVPVRSLKPANALVAGSGTWALTFGAMVVSIMLLHIGAFNMYLSNYGCHRKGLNKTTDECFEYFKSIYLREGAPSVETAWSRTLGFAKRQGFDCVSNFPTSKNFIRTLSKRK